MTTAKLGYAPRVFSAGPSHLAAVRLLSGSGPRRATASALAAAAVALFAPKAFAQPPAPASSGRAVTAAPAQTPDGQGSSGAAPLDATEAREHFKRARELYQQGAYREAIAELERARTLDPHAKDLIFNLAVVHEKLADIDDALKYFRLYETMGLTDQERERAEAYLRRLEGAKKELDASANQELQARKEREPPTTPLTSQTQTAEPLPPPRETPPGRGRVDAATISAATLTLLSLGFGTFMGIKAKSDQPAAGFVTGPDGSYAHLQDLAMSAHREAIYADVGFGVTVLAGAATLYLYFGRTSAPDAAAPGKPAKVPLVTAAPTRNGGALVLQGSF
jgi:tetratricopeptide (TPR) repeat protein